MDPWAGLTARTSKVHFPPYRVPVSELLRFAESWDGREGTAADVIASLPGGVESAPPGMTAPSHDPINRGKSKINFAAVNRSMVNRPRLPAVNRGLTRSMRRIRSTGTHREAHGTGASL